MQAPSLLVVETFVEHLRHDPNADGETPTHKGATIRSYVNSLRSVCRRYGVDEIPGFKKSLKARVKNYENKDGNVSAEAFDMSDGLPKLWAACWSMTGWKYDKMLQTWTMFLIALCLMARASCIAGAYSPKYEDLELPPEAQWDTDGYPKYITINLS